MSETVNQGSNVASGQEPKTFTQEELNSIVSERLKRESSKYEDYEELKAKAARLDELEEANKSEIEKAKAKAEKLQSELEAIKKTNEVREVRQKVSDETKVPANLLTGDTEEACREQAKAILEFAKPSGYPSVKDGGEVQNLNAGSTRDKFADWMAQQLNGGK